MNYKLRAQKLSLVRGEHTLIVGVDIAKSKHWARILDGRTELPVGQPFAFQNSKAGFERLLFQIAKALKDTGATRVVVGMEPTGHYWKALAAYLQASGITVVTVSPLHVKRAKEFEDNSPTKNDQKDAWVIARRVNDGDFFYPRLPEGVYADLRVLTQSRQEARIKRNQAQNQIRAIIDECFPEFTFIFADPSGLAASHALQNFPFPDDVLAMPVEKIAEELSQASKGRIGMKHAFELSEAAKNSIGVRQGIAAMRLRLRQRVEELTFWSNQMAEIEAAMAEALDKIRVARYLLSVPGVGVVTVASFLGETGDLSQYTDWRQLRKLAGFNLKESSSGQYAGRPRISKRGRSHLRCLLYQAALVLVVRNAQFKALFQYLKAREQNPLKGKQALVAIACKLIRVFFALATKECSYDPAVVLGEFRNTQLGIAA